MGNLKIGAIILIFLMTGSIWSNNNFDVSAQESKIPEWVKKIFNWYSQGQISEDELLGAIRFLVENNIVRIEKSSQIPDVGDFKIVYESPHTPKYFELEKVLKNGKSFEQLVDSLNKTFLLPMDITITLTECGKVNAFYDQKNKKLSMCYEMIEYLWKYAKSTTKTTDQTREEWAHEANETLSGLIVFIFAHEIGHALIDVYDLPVTGREEDAVDQLATMFLLSNEQGNKFLISATKFFLTKGVLDVLAQDLVFWDEHSLNLQRFYNIVCLQYGKDPQKYSSFISNGFLPEERSIQCKGEYEKYDKSWKILLLPYANQKVINR